MENASKALLIAGGVLIALLIIGALILMFSNLTAYQQSNSRNVESDQIAEFNKQYETYNRNDVRGSDIYSLVNKVVSYNRTKTNNVIDTNDEGTDWQYMPMSITIDFDRQDKMKDFTIDNDYNELKLFKPGNMDAGKPTIMTINKATSNKLSDVFSSITTIENTYGGKDALVNLTTGINNLFDKTSEEDIRKAVDLWNNNVKSSARIANSSDIDILKANYQNGINNNNVKNNIKTYYEYLQFKRAHFNSDNSKVEYDPQTGRILSLYFKYNGKIN